MLEDAPWYFWCSAPTPDGFGVMAEISGLNSTSRSSRLKFVGTLVLSFLDVTFGEGSTILKSPIEIKIWGQLSGVSKRRKKGHVTKHLSWESEYIVCSLQVTDSSGGVFFWCQQRQRITPCFSHVSWECE